MSNQPEKKVVRRRRATTGKARVVEPPPEGEPWPKRAKLTPRMQAIADGRIPVDELDDEELLRGVLRDKNGNIGGKPPIAIPREMHRAVVEEVIRRTEGSLIGDLEDMYDVLKQIALSKSAAAVARNQAAIYIIERISGKIPEKSQVNVQISKFEELVESGTILYDLEAKGALPSAAEESSDDNIVDAEVIDAVQKTRRRYK